MTTENVSLLLTALIEHPVPILVALALVLGGIFLITRYLVHTLSNIKVKKAKIGNNEIEFLDSIKESSSPVKTDHIPEPVDEDLDTDKEKFMISSTELVQIIKASVTNALDIISDKDQLIDNKKSQLRMMIDQEFFPDVIEDIKSAYEKEMTRHGGRDYDIETDVQAKSSRGELESILREVRFRVYTFFNDNDLAFLSDEELSKLEHQLTRDITNSIESNIRRLDIEKDIREDTIAEAKEVVKTFVSLALKKGKKITAHQQAQLTSALKRHEQEIAEILKRERTIEYSDRMNGFITEYLRTKGAIIDKESN